MADPTLYLYTSLTAGSSHIITATSRLETILKANKIPFRALDCATDEKARTLWSRRSRGRKLPGLVKFGQVIGDLEQIEEWNEFGELHDQIDSADDFFDSSEAPANPNTITLRPEPGPGVANSLTPIQPAPGRKLDSTAASNVSSRASSESRHISISEPTAKGREARSPAATPSENPMTLTMRQLGAEAAAKAKDVKKKATSTAPTSTPKVEPTVISDTAVPNPTAAKEREASDPAQEPDVTAAKTPTQLAAEGAKRTSIDKIDSTTGAASSTPTSARATSTEVNEEVSEPAEPSNTKSTEEQVLHLRKQSTQVDIPSNLHESISADADEPEKSQDTALSLTAEADAAKKDTTSEDVEPPVAEAGAEKDTPASTEGGPVTTDSEKELPASTDTDTANAAEETTGDSKTGNVPFNQPFSDSDKPIVPVISDNTKPDTPGEPRSHRGSSVETADKADIMKIEEQNKIEEHPEEDEAAVVDDTDSPAVKPPVEPEESSKEAAEAAKPSETPAETTQKTAAKDPTAATKSVED